MSGAIRPAQSALRLPRAGAGAVTGPAFDDAMQQLERALAVAVREGTTPSLPALILTAADGSSWRVTVATNGQLRSSAVAR